MGGDDVPDGRAQTAVSARFAAPLCACLVGGCPSCKAAAGTDKGNGHLLARPCCAALVMAGCACPAGTEEDTGAATAVGLPEKEGEAAGALAACPRLLHA